MNPFYEHARPADKLYMDWNKIYPKPYRKEEVDPYTKVRIILMNGTEFEANWFSHQFHRHCPNNDLRRELAVARRVEQQQQKRIACLKPINETILEHTIGYEQLAVDLTAILAQREPDPYVVKVMDLALLEDFDHLYRYANLLDFEKRVHAEDLVGCYTEIMPGRPTISEHRDPHDSVRYYCDFSTAAPITKLNTAIITAAEQQTMNYYMNQCAFYESDLGRKLYQEIAMIEEQHVTQYGALLDTTLSWLENLLLHEYTECYLYYSCMNDEIDMYIRRIWEEHFEQELSHLHLAAHLLRKYEGKEWQQVIPNGEFPELLKFTPQKEYVRKVLKDTVYNTALRENPAVPVSEMPMNADFFKYQATVNPNVNMVASHNVINETICRFGQDYRYEDAPNPIPALRDRNHDNTDVGRKR
ncbi:MAG: hypothetical protein U0K86_09800 [Agathobacter sp.]|nr:hypothetical protein [Agathobacter sp.]